MKQVVLNVEGMTCSACKNGLEKYLNKQEGIKSASVNLVLKTALIEYDDSLVISDLENFIKEAGFTSKGIYVPKIEPKKSYQKTILIVFGILAFLMMYMAMGHMFHLPEIRFLKYSLYPKNLGLTEFFLTIPFLIYGLDIFKSGFKNLIHKTPNMDTLVSLSIISSFLYSLYNLGAFLIKGGVLNNLYFEACALIIFFIKLGRYLDNLAINKTKDALQDLVSLTPEKAYLKTSDKIKEVTLDEIKKGDILICKTGATVAVDGKIVGGEAYLDEALITGESTAVKKSINSQVIAGSINLNGYFEYEAIAIGRESTISKIVDLVSKASSKKAPIEKIADKISGYFVMIVFGLSILTFIGHLVLGFNFNTALISFVTVLVVACPCSLGLATPLAMMVSLGNCAKNGILIKDSAILEEAKDIDTIVFDKTGTLTYGKLKIAHTFNYNKDDLDTILSIVASIEAKSEHPLGKAFVNYAKDKKLKLFKTTDFKNIEGKGISAKYNDDTFYIGNAKLLKDLNITDLKKKDADTIANDGASLVYAVKNMEVMALIGIKDIVRDSAFKAIKDLQNLDKKVVMLTGDNKTTAKIIGNSLNIDTIKSEVLPAEKNAYITELTGNKHKIMMVGDGINDAPSLVTANIGVSLSNSTDIASSAAGVILLNEDLTKIPYLINMSKKAMHIVKLNLFWAFIYNILMIPIAMGLFTKFNLSISPMLGSLAMMFSSLGVILNSLRLKRVKIK